MIRLLTFVLLFSTSIHGQLIKTDIFTVEYSEEYEQPLWVEYVVKCPDGNASRQGMDFWVPEGIKTSDDDDYRDNIWDKGHLAPAAAFSCDREMLHKTFSYLNSALQLEGLNRGQWSRLEAFERDAANFFGKEVKVRVDVLFQGKLGLLPTGATVPSGFRKSITIGDITRVFEFPNADTKGTSWINYLIK